MRYYSILISNPTDGTVITPPGFSADLLGGATYTSFVRGKSLPEAWNVELDLPIIGAASPQGFGLVRVWGISVAEIAQANRLGPKASLSASAIDTLGMNINIFGGFQKGLPLANPKQNGLLFSGSIVQAFGNWIGTDMTLDLVVMPGLSSESQPGGIGTLRNPKNIVLSWKAGTPLSDAIKSALQTAFPGYTVTVNVSSNVVRNYDETGYFPTIEQLADFAKEVSLDIVKTANYPGITILPPALNNTISVFDMPIGSTATTPAPLKQISFVDLIGQPTWLEGGVISLKTPMRADLHPGDQIALPPTVIVNNADSASTLINQRATFQGGFSVQSGRHIGNFRNPSGDGWVSVFSCAPNALIGT